MQEMLTYISNNGFAIVLCVYMVVVNNKSIKENTEATNKIGTLIETLISTTKKEWLNG